VITSDKPASELKNIMTRLTSRFEVGLTVDIQVPDLEHRIEILKRKLASESSDIHDIPNNVLEFIASSFVTNIRELEGALKRVLFYCLTNNLDMTVETVNEALEPLLKTKRKSDSLNENNYDRIQSIVSDFYGITLDDLVGKKRHSKYILPRHIAMYIIKLRYNIPYKTIGSLFGDRDHSTVLAACEKIDNDLKQDAALKIAVDTIIKKIATYNGRIDYDSKTFFLIFRQTKIRTDPIHYDDGIIDGISENGEHRGNKKGVDFKFREKRRCDDIETENDNEVLKKRDRRYGSEREARKSFDGTAERVGDIERNGDDDECESHIRGFFDIIPERFSDVDVSGHSHFHGAEARKFPGDILFEFRFQSLEILFGDTGNLRKPRFDDEFIFSGNLIDIDVVYNLRTVVSDVFFGLFRQGFDGGKIDLSYAVIILRLNPTGHIDSEVEGNGQIRPERKYNQYECDTVIHKTVLDKIDFHKDTIIKR